MLNECTAIYAGGKFDEISEFYVAPRHRSAGVGALLVDAAADFGRNRAGWSLKSERPMCRDGSARSISILDMASRKLAPGSGCTFRRYFRRAQRETITMIRKE